MVDEKLSVALWFEHSSVRSRPGFKAQPMRALAGGLACWCLDLIGRQTGKMDGVDRCYSSCGRYDQIRKSPNWIMKYGILLIIDNN